MKDTDMVRRDTLLLTFPLNGAPTGREIDGLKALIGGPAIPYEDPDGKAHMGIVLEVTELEAYYAESQQWSLAVELVVEVVGE